MYDCQYSAQGASVTLDKKRRFEASCRADKEDQERADAVKCRRKGRRHELCRIRSAPAKRRTKGILVCNNIRQLPGHFQI